MLYKNIRWWWITWATFVQMNCIRQMHTVHMTDHHTQQKETFLRLLFSMQHTKNQQYTHLGAWHTWKNRQRISRRVPSQQKKKRKYRICSFSKLNNSNSKPTLQRDYNLPFLVQTPWNSCKQKHSSWVPYMTFKTLMNSRHIPISWLYLNKVFAVFKANWHELTQRICCIYRNSAREYVAAEKVDRIL